MQHVGVKILELDHEKFTVQLTTLNSMLSLFFIFKNNAAYSSLCHTNILSDWKKWGSRQEKASALATFSNMPGTIESGVEYTLRITPNGGP